MLFRLDLKRSVVSSWLVLIFFIVVLTSAAFSQFFQAPKSVNESFSNYQNLLEPGKILGLKKLIINNGLGEFHLEKRNSGQTKGWQITKPRKLPAQVKLVDNFVQVLSQSKIRSVYAKDSINISNYSLDNPSLEVSLINNEDRKTTLSFGLNNPIDNSTFVSLSNQEAIYQIDNIKNSFNRVSLTALIDSRVFPFAHDSITEVKIKRFINKKPKVLFHIKKSLNDWKGPKDELLNKKKVDQYLKDLFTLKSNTILDSVTEKQSEQIETYFENPSYQILVTTSESKSFIYDTTYLIRKIKGIKINKNKKFFTRNTLNNESFIYALDKETLSLLYRSKRKMKRFQIKKLFY